MCGIAGIVSLNKESIALQKLKAMTDSIAHRGPDGEGHWLSEDRQVALGHRRLSIIDLSHAADQPMHFLDRYVIVFNGEIYNYIELKAALLKEGCHFKTQSDTEVLLALYDKKGERCLDELDGMFAFAIWDKQEQTLFCARDRFGEKPFYYHYNGRSFYFASEMKALWAGGIEKKANNKMYDHFETTGGLYLPDAPAQTFYDQILKLEHSHWLKLKFNGELVVNRYFDVDWQNQSFNGSIEEAAEEFKYLFRLSLKRRFRADVSVGSSLSGGLDSSSIVCNMKSFIGKGQVSPHSFSARFSGFKKDEGVFIEKVIERTGITPHYTWPDGKELLKDFDALCYHQEEPFGSTSIYAQYRVQQLAKENKVTVLIDGQGADEILAGYQFYYTTYLLSLQSKKNSLWERLAEQKKYLEFHTPHRGLKKKLMQYSHFYEWRHRISHLKNGIHPPLNKALYEHTMGGWLQDLLRYADRNAMAHSREVRLPFLNHDLVQFCFSLPDRYKLYRGWTKYVMRKAFNEVLPEEIAWRKDKIGFEPPQNEWLNQFGSKLNWRDIMLSCYKRS